jgi:hypothetical protein
MNYPAAMIVKDVRMSGWNSFNVRFIREKTKHCIQKKKNGPMVTDVLASVLSFVSVWTASCAFMGH